ncbi:MAG: class I SAM-dependent methyltransferase [Candidatus Methanofastidiosia archaeon]
MKPLDCEALYSDGRHYDCQHKDFVEDIPFFLRQIKKYGGPVLELACGTGRITIPLAEKGIDITGLDVSEPMLIHAKRKAAAKNVGIEWINADCRSFKLDKKFKLIFFPFNSIAHLHDMESIEACFSRVREHLTAGGRFIIDIFNPRLGLLTRDPAKRYPVAEYPDPDGRGKITITENNIYDAANQINKIKWHYRIGEDKEVVVELNMRIFFPKELDALLLYNGFTIEAKFGDYDETLFESTSPKQLIICHPK